MRIAVPLAQGKFSLHFGHCDEFAVFEVDKEDKRIINTEFIQPPAHEPGALPRWLSGLQVNTVIAGGMGQRAQMMLNDFDIDVLTGARGESAEVIVQDYLEDKLTVGDNICDH